MQGRVLPGPGLRNTVIQQLLLGHYLGFMDGRLRLYQWGLGQGCQIAAVSLSPKNVYVKMHEKSPQKYKTNRM